MCIFGEFTIISVVYRYVYYSKLALPELWHQDEKRDSCHSPPEKLSFHAWTRAGHACGAVKSNACGANVTLIHNPYCEK